MIFARKTDRIAAWTALSLVGVALLLSLLLPSDLLLSSPDTDMVSEFVSSRAYLADSLRAGFVPLWNPYTYGGQPFLSGFESAVLYPLNLLFLLLPLGPALNFSMLLHLVILGWGMERWASRRGLDPWAAGLAGCVAPLSGAVFPHLYAGHLSNLCTMAWAPLVFMGLEIWARHGERRGLFLASAAICLQILAGHVQYVFYTAVAAGLQALVLTITHPAARRRALPGLAGCYLAAAALGAAQLLPGWAASAESIRQQKLDFSFAAMFGFPPENFLTLIAPGFFGNLGLPTYWGRCYLWEMSLFIGTVSPLLIAAALCDNERRKQAVLDLAVAVPLLVLALGVHTPLFGFLYEAAPGFGHFRAWSKFIFPATLFLVLVAASGADLLLRGRKPEPKVAWTGLAAGVVAALASLILLFQPDEITVLFHLVLASRESYLPPAAFNQPDFIQQSGIHAGLSLALAGLVLIAAATVLLLLGRRPHLRWVVPGILLVEMIGFSTGQVAVSHFSDAAPDELRQFIAAHPGDYRVLDLARGNNGFLLGAGDLWGNNPTVLRRYAEFISFTQGADPDHATQYVNFQAMNPLYAMLRCRYAFVPADNGSIKVVESKNAPMPHLLLVSDWQTSADRNALFSAMNQPSFDPAKKVLLETDPQPRPQPGAAGFAKLISERPDELIIEAQTDRPALLLITDLYTRDWRAEALPDSSQKQYQLLPADYILRAIPLQAGHHLLRVVYAPEAFPLGAAVSALAWLAWIVFFWRVVLCKE